MEYGFYALSTFDVIIRIISFFNDFLPCIYKFQRNRNKAISMKLERCKNLLLFCLSTLPGEASFLGKVGKSSSCKFCAMAKLMARGKQNPRASVDIVKQETKPEVIFVALWLCVRVQFCFASGLSHCRLAQVKPRKMLP